MPLVQTSDSPRLRGDFGRISVPAMRALAWAGLLALATWQTAANPHSGMLIGYAELKKEGDDALLPRDVQSCGRTADAWLDRQLALPPPAPLDNPDKLLYFLHIPRTAGRSFHTCFLAFMLPKRCPVSYNTNNFEEHEDKEEFKTCELLASHEDYSTVTSMQMHLHRNPTVITQLRDPVDRLLSAYEFAVEVALRMALKPPAQRHQNRERPQPPPMPGRPGRPDRKLPQKRNATRTDTVWPWSQIVPMMLEDIVQRYLDGGWKPTHDAPSGPEVTDELRFIHPASKNKERATRFASMVMRDPTLLDPYNNSYIMPLHEFIENPLVKWNIHNGATKQYTGLSHTLDEDGQEVMKCYESTQGHGQVVDAVSRLANHRVHSMALLGTTHGFKDLGRLVAHLSNISLTQSVDPSRQRASQARNRGDRRDPYYDDPDHNEHHQQSRRRRRRSLLREEPRNNPPRRISLARSMGQCLANTKENYKRQHATVHTNSGLPFMFSSATRALIDPRTLERAASLNAIDSQLFHVAEERLAADLATYSSHPDFPAVIEEELTVRRARPDALGGGGGGPRDWSRGGKPRAADQPHRDEAGEPQAVQQGNEGATDDGRMGRLKQLLDPRIHQLLERTFGLDWRSKVVNQGKGSQLVRLPSSGFRTHVNVHLPTSVPSDHHRQEGDPLDEAHMRQYAARLRTPDTLDEIDKMTDVIELLEAAVADEAAGAHGAGQGGGWTRWVVLAMGTCCAYTMLRRRRNGPGRARRPGRGDALPLVAGAAVRRPMSWLGLGGHKRPVYKV